MTTEAPNAGRATTGLHQSHGSFELVLSPTILALGGWWLDGRLGTGPWIAILAAVVGFVGATIKLIVSYRAQMEAYSRSTFAPSRPSRRTA